MGLGDEYYKVGDFGTAADWFAKVTGVEPDGVRGFLALGAANFNAGDLGAAETAWKRAAEIDDTNVEAHYDLGFLYLNRQPADMDAVKLHWTRVVELAPDSDVAKTVKAHLDAFAGMSPAPGATTAPGATAAPGATTAPSTAPSVAPDASATPAATPAPTATPVP
jgi:tetratricopeptide (TPR) repeat protein